MSLRRRLVSKSTIIFVARVGGAGLIFLVQAAIARFWSPEILGEYLIVIAAANLLAITLPMGFQTIGIFFAAEYAASDAGRSLKRFAGLAYGMIMFPGLLIILLAGSQIWRFGAVGPLLSFAWLPISLLAIGTAIVFVSGSILVGLKRPFSGFLTDTISRPFLIIGAFALAWFVSDDANRVVTLLWWLSGSYMIVALGHALVAWRAILRVSQSKRVRPNEFRRWWHFSVPWLLITLSSDFFFDLDVMMLSQQLGKEQIAIFGVCARIFVLMFFGISAVYAISLPDFLQDEANADEQALVRRIGDANLVAFGLGAVLLVLIFFFAPFVLALFGDAFSGGFLPLMILCSSLIARAIFGPGAILLSARNHPFASLPAIGLGFVVLIAGNLLLVPALGLVGAALAATLSFLVVSAVLWRTALQLTGTDVSVFPALRNLLPKKSGALHSPD